MKSGLLFSVLVLLVISIKAKADPSPDEGKTIFLSRCAACHNVNKTVIGPALAGIDERRSIDWIINFVHSSQSVVKSGDGYAASLFAKFNKVQMPDHPDLSADNIKSIVAYIKRESKVAATDKASTAKPSPGKLNYVRSMVDNPWALFGLLGSVLLLIAALLLRVKVNRLKKESETRKLPITS
jgi:mono/diheme cytochrome c family protein